MISDNIPKSLKAVHITTLLAGLTLLLLFPVARMSLKSWVFLPLWYIHIATQVAAAFTSILFLLVLITRSGKIGLFVGLLTLVWLVTLVLQSLLPIVSRDALIYHLAVPKLWIEAGQMTELPWHEWSYFPLLTSLGYSGFLIQDVAVFTQLYQASYLIIAAAVIAGFCSRVIPDQLFAILGYFVTLSLPVAFRLGSEPMADCTVLMFCSLGFALAFEWAAMKRRWQYLIGGGIAFGLALGSKYNPLLCACLFIPLFVVMARGYGLPLSRALSGLAIIGGTALVVYSPWAVQNYWWTGNPVFPFLKGVFGPTGTHEAFKRILPIEYRLLIYHESLLDIVLIPLRMILFGADGSAKTFDGQLSPVLLLMFVPFYVLRRKGSPQPWVAFACLMVSSFFLFNLFLFDTVVRYLAPVALLAIGLTMMGLWYVYNLSSARKQLVLAIFLGVHTAVSAWYLIDLFKRTDTLAYLTSDESSDSYLRQHVSEYGFAKDAQKALPTNAKLYLIYTGNRYFYYDNTVRGSYFSADILKRGLGEKGDPESLLKTLSEEEITHLAIHERRLQNILKDTFSKVQQRGWETFRTTHLTQVLKTPFASLEQIR